MSTLYRVPILDKFEWQKTVKDKDLTAPPGSPTKGDRYIVKATGSGAWAGQDNALTYWDGSSWIFITPTEGYITWVNDEDLYYYWDGTQWKRLHHKTTADIDEFFVEVMG